MDITQYAEQFGSYDHSGNGATYNDIVRQVVQNMITDGSLQVGSGSGGSISVDEIASAVAAYIEANPDIVSNSSFSSSYHWSLSNAATFESGSLSDTTGEEIEKAKYGRTGFEAVTPGETLYFGYCGLWWYDSNKAFVSKAPSAASSGYNVTVPDGVSYVRASGTGTSGKPGSFHVYRNGYGKYGLNYASTYDYSNGFPMLASDDSMTGFRNYLNINPYRDCSFGIIGDSFTAPGTWVNDMLANLGAMPKKSPSWTSGGHWSYSTAVSGGAFSDYDGVPATGYEQALSFVEKGYDIDVFLICLGTNDAANRRPVGSFVGSTNISDFDLTTFYGGMQACFNTIQENYPNAVIFCGYTPNAGQAAGDVADSSAGTSGGDFSSGGAAYIAAMKDCCLRYGIQYIETRACGYSRYATSLSDCFASSTNGHPSTVGQHKIGKYMTAILRAQGGWVDLRS